MKSRDRSSSTSERGSSILVAVVLILVLTVVGLSVASRATAEGDAAGAKRHYDKSVTCADAAGEYLLSQFRTFGASPTSITLATPVEDRVMATGHFDQIAVTGVRTALGAAQAAAGATDVANRLSRLRLGGTFYRLTVVCASTQADGGPTRQAEVEYLVRFGL